MPRAMPFTATSATAALRTAFGAPERWSGGGGASVECWEIDAGGDGIEFARLSSRDVQGGETAAAQLAPVRDLSQRLPLSARLIVVTTNNSGARRFEERPDFAIASRAIEDGWCRWISWRSADRIARADLPLALFYDLLRRTGTLLYLAELGRAVDWERDQLELGVRGIIGEQERIAIKKRTHGALERAWLDTGRGWPGKRPFGFRRHWATKHLEPDPEQWPFIMYIHRRYPELVAEGSGLRVLSAELAAMGCEISTNRVRRVLDDPIYATGEYTVTYGGKQVACQPVPLDEPVPLSLLQANRELLSLNRGRATKTPLGSFCLNGLPFLHARCMHVRRGNEAPILKGRLHANRPVAVYRHEPFVPEGCRGYVLDRATIEPPIMAALRTLARDQTLAISWAAAQRAPAAFAPQPFAGQRSHLERQIGKLERQAARLARDFRTRLAAGERANELAYWELVGGIRAEVAQLRARLRAAEGEISPLALPGAEDGDLVAAFAALLTDEVPADEQVRLGRASLVSALVEGVVVHDHKDGSVEIELLTPFSSAQAGTAAA